MTLIRQLDFKPNQLKILQTSQPPVAGPAPVASHLVPIMPGPGPLMSGVPRPPVMAGQEMRPAPPAHIHIHLQSRSSPNPPQQPPDLDPEYLPRISSSASRYTTNLLTNFLGDFDH